MSTDRRGFLAGIAATWLWPHKGRAATPPDTPDVTWVSGADRDIPANVYNLATARTPEIRALCRSTKGVSAAVNWARDEGMPFSIQSGGHCFAGLSQSNGLTIDLRHLDDLSMQGSVLVAGSGARILDINQLTKTIGHALPAGYCQHVALGGHVGGGGLGVLSRPFGLTCDQLIAARMVMADGRIQNVTPHETPDLFWAVQGGGSGSFGIVTEWQLKTHPIEQAHFAEIFWLLPPVKAALLIRQWQEICAQMEPGLSCFMYVQSHSAGRLRLQLRLIAISTRMQMQDAVTSLAAMAPPLVQPDLRSGTYKHIADVMWPPDFNPSERLKIASRYLPAELPGDAWFHLLSLLDDTGTSGPALSIQQLGGAIAEKTPAATAYPHRNAAFLAQFGVQLLPGDNALAGSEALASAIGILDGSGAHGAYINYPDPAQTDWPERYWGDNLDRLRSTKLRYDPHDLFRHAQSVPLP